MSMAYVATGSVIRQIGAIFDGSSVAGLTDRQLLERFITRSDPAGEAAFAALVMRHGPMVLQVCRQILGDLHHAEDAFQAVFLVLARRARSIRDPELLGNWLYGVAIRTARCARLQIDRQHRNDEEAAMRRPDSGSMSSSTVVEQAVLAREDMEALHDEIARLPGSFRLPVVLCYFEGLTLDEAAQRLRWPAGTVRSRLARARDKLRRGLTRRGVVLPGAVLATVLCTRTASAHVSSPLCATTTRAAISFAAREAVREVVSSSVAILAQDVIRGMYFTKLNLTLATLLVVSFVASGVGYLTRSSAMKAEPRPAAVAIPQPQPAVKQDEPDRQARGRMTVVGRVLDPTGKPVAGAMVDVMGRARKPRVAATSERETGFALGQAMTDASGYFRLDAPRTSSGGFFSVYAMAGAPGFGLGWVKLNSDAAQPVAEIRLRDEQMIQGKLVDVYGQPAAGIGLRVGSVGKYTDDGLFDGVTVNDLSAEGLRNWPEPIATDAQGRFTLARMGRDLSVSFIVDDPRFALQKLAIVTDDRPGPKDVTLALQPGTTVEGQILAADTVKPISNALVQVGSSQEQFVGGGGRRIKTDVQGRYTANVTPGKYYRVEAVPPEGQPYLIHNQSFEWTKGEVKKVIDLKLPRGVLIQGKVTEQGTARPLAAAYVQYYPAGNHDGLVSGWQALVGTASDGSFQIAVPAGKGHVLVFGPTSDFVLKEIGGRTLYNNGQPGGTRYYAHDIVAYDLKAGGLPHELNVALRPGKTVRGHVVGPDGQTVEDAAIITRLHIVPTNPSWRGDFQLHARDGEFELHGLDPEKSAPVYFLDADHQWGATVEFSGKQAEQAVTVRLQPCGKARARFLDAAGKPIVRMFPHFEILGTPGPTEGTSDNKEKAIFAADAAYMPNVDRKHYWHGPYTDTEGRLILPDLIPGALYRITDNSNRNKGDQIRRDFTVKPGETLDLGDILIEKPPQ